VSGIEMPHEMLVSVVLGKFGLRHIKVGTPERISNNVVRYL